MDFPGTLGNIVKGDGSVKNIKPEIFLLHLIARDLINIFHHQIPHWF
jgi:hypothetical protein